MNWLEMNGKKHGKAHKSAHTAISITISKQQRPTSRVTYFHRLYFSTPSVRQIHEVDCSTD